MSSPLLLQRWRFALCGSLSTALLRANFLTSSGSCIRDLPHTSAASGEEMLNMCPSLSRLNRWFRLTSRDSSSTTSFALFERLFLEKLESLTITSLTTTLGLNLEHCRDSSRCRPFSAMSRTHGSGEVRRRLWRRLKSTDISGRFRPPNL